MGLVYPESETFFVVIRFGDLVTAVATDGHRDPQNRRIAACITRLVPAQVHDSRQKSSLAYVLIPLCSSNSILMQVS
jgi:hypothetical protein